MTFEELNLIAPVLRSVKDEKYTSPTPIQMQAIPPVLRGRDVLGCAQTGTGKTAAFALPILNRLGQVSRKAKPNRPRVLVLAPTRELAIQIGDSFETYGRHLRLRHVLIYGGVSQRRQVRILNRGAHIVVATPGRLIDLLGQGHIKLDELDVFVLDEADRMLDMGFLPDIKRLIRLLPSKRQSLFFSATLAPKIIDLSRELLTDPVSVNVKSESTSVGTIDQSVIFTERSRKLNLLRETLAQSCVERALVFTRTKHGANALAGRLVKSGFTADAIHGNKSQNARQRALDAFRRKEVQVLVATDVAARGIDIDHITHVVNFDMPVEPENYVHRIGRTGRAGADGVAVSYCTSDERRGLRAIEQLIGRKVAVVTDDQSEPDETGKSTPTASRRKKASRPARPTARGKQKSGSAGSRPASRSEVRSKQRRQRRRKRRTRQSETQSG